MGFEEPRKQRRRDVLLASLAGFAGGLWGHKAGNLIESFRGSPDSVQNTPEAKSEFNEVGFLERGPSNRQATYDEFFRRFVYETGYVPERHQFEISDDGIITLTMWMNEAPISVRLLSAEQAQQYPVVEYVWFKARVIEVLSEYDAFKSA